MSSRAFPLLASICVWAMFLAAQSSPVQVPVRTATPVSVLAGEKLLIELETSLHTRTTRKGAKVSFRTLQDIRVGDQVAIPRRSLVRGTVTRAKRAGRIAGKAEIQLRLDEVRLPDGTSLKLPATIERVGVNRIERAKDGDPKVRADSGGGGDVGAILHGGAQGAVIGVIGGGAKGAMYGGAVGAGVGLAQVLLKRGPDVDLPRNTIFEARFDKPLEVPAEAVRRATEVTRAGAPPVNLELRIPAEEPPPDFRDPERPRLGRRAPTAAEPPVERAKIDPPADVPAPSPASAAPPAYEPAAADPSAFKLSVSVKLVQVDALVRDRTGRPMDKLRREDFRLFENGAEQPIQSFSRDELPLAVALVIDRSGSVAPFMDEIRHAAYRALMQLKPGDEVCLFTFAGDVDRLEDLTTDRQRIADRIATIRAGGGTNIVDAVYNSVNYLGLVAPARRRAIILISDNQATTHPRASEGQAIRLAMETETVVYSVKTGGEGLPLTLRLPNLIGGGASVRRITEETGGEIIEVATAGSLDAALRTAVERLKLRYTLGYYPENPAPGTFRKIEVRLAVHFGQPVVDYRVNSRRGYYYPSPIPAASAK